MLQRIELSESRARRALVARRFPGALLADSLIRWYPPAWNAAGARHAIHPRGYWAPGDRYDRDGIVVAFLVNCMACPGPTRSGLLTHWTVPALESDGTGVDAFGDIMIEAKQIGVERVVFLAPWLTSTVMELSVVLDCVAYAQRPGEPVESGLDG